VKSCSTFDSALANCELELGHRADTAVSSHSPYTGTVPGMRCHRVHVQYRAQAAVAGHRGICSKMLGRAHSKEDGTNGRYNHQKQPVMPPPPPSTIQLPVSPPPEVKLRRHRVRYCTSLCSLFRLGPLALTPILTAGNVVGWSRAAACKKLHLPAALHAACPLRLDSPKLNYFQNSGRVPQMFCDR